MPGTLHIFDFDDTLIKSNAQINISHDDGTTSQLNSKEFATYVTKPGDEFDFSEFETYPQGGETIPQTFHKLQLAIEQAGANNVLVLTARSLVKPIRQFLKNNGLKQRIAIATMGSADPAAKAQFVSQKLSENDYDRVHVYEDNIRNIQAIKQTAEDFDVEFSHTLVVSEYFKKKDINNLKLLIREHIKMMMTRKRQRHTPGAGIIILKKFTDGYRVLGLKLLGSYDLPKGKIEKNESTFNAALRETEEECGITDLIFPWGLSRIRAGCLTLFIGETQQDPIINKNPTTGMYEHLGSAWLTWDEIEDKISDHLYPAIITARDLVNSIHC